jgi:putative nucleotidyltransferase with HDIG domain
MTGNNGKKSGLRPSMPSKKKLSLGKGAKKEGHHRDWYARSTSGFVDWVEKLGIEKTFLGNLAFSLERRFKLRRLATLFLLCVCLAFILTSNLEYVYTGYKIGEIASNNIKAPVSFEIVDEQQTSMKKKEAEAAVPPVFDFDPGIYETIDNNVNKAFREMRALIRMEKWPSKGVKRQEKVRDFLRYQGDFEELLGFSGLSNRMFEWLVQNRFSVRVEIALGRILESNLSEKIVQDLQSLREAGREKVIVRIVEGDGGGEEFTAELAELKDLDAVRKSLTIKSPKGILKKPENQKMLLTLAEDLMRPNLTLNQQETAVRKQKAKEGVLPVAVSVKKGQVVITEGTVIQPIHIKILDEIRKVSSNPNQELNTLVLSVLLITIILVFLSYLRRFTLNRVRISLNDFLAMAAITITVVAVSKIFLYLLSEGFEDRISAFVPSSFFVYLIPAAAGPMLVGLIIMSGEVVWLYAVFMGVVLSAMVEFSYPFFLYSVVSGIAAARGVHACKRRNDIYWAGLRTGLINLFVIALVTMGAQSLSEFHSLGRTVFWNSLAGFLAGNFSAFLAMMVVPLVETVFNYTTDVKLLELSNLNHPLLKEMIVKAPGTYHHSLVVGNMVEAAAEGIGANPLLAKVCAYYHDIGKVEHSGYFIENQKANSNPHDHLSPNMSKHVLVAHVKDGVELGHKHKLGKPIIDVIQQHHGTTLIQFFYNKAKESDDEKLQKLTEEDFRYPGPRPQFREAALCMLADSIEAAARSCDEPNSVRLQNIVRNIIQRKFMDGQLNECDLTLKDLSVIEDAFIKILLGIYHQRIDYPRHAGGGAAESPEKKLNGAS